MPVFALLPIIVIGIVIAVSRSAAEQKKRAEQARRAAQMQAEAPVQEGQTSYTPVRPSVQIPGSKREAAATAAQKTNQSPLTKPSKPAQSMHPGHDYCALRPGFCNPTAFSIPAGHSAIRGAECPKRGSLVVPLKENVPKILMSYSSANSQP